MIDDTGEEIEYRYPSNIKRIVDKIKGLPTLPSMLEQLNKMMEDPNTSAKQVGQLISHDPTITAKVLRVVNSSFYGFSNRISTISHAVSILGFNTIRSIVLSTTIFDSLKGRQESRGFNRKDFWLHSLGVGVAAKVIANRQGLASALEEFFIAGLLHDVGKIIIDQFMGADFERIINEVLDSDSLMYYAEQRVLGGSHTDVGSLLMNKWRLSPMLTAVVHFHHKPGEAGKYTQAASIVHMADIIARAMVIGNGGDNKMPPIQDAAWESLGLELSDLDEIIADVDKDLKDAMIFMEFAK